MTNTTALQLSLTDYRMLDIVRENPGTIERRIDSDEEVQFYQNGRYATPANRKSILRLLRSGLLTVRPKKIHTVGLREPRTAHVLYAA